MWGLSQHHTYGLKSIYMALSAHRATLCDPRSGPSASPRSAHDGPPRDRAAVLSAAQHERGVCATFDPCTWRGWRAAPAKGLEDELRAIGKNMLALHAIAAAEPPAPATTTLALRKWICARARPAFQWERSVFDAPGPRRQRSSSSGSQTVQLLNPPLAQSEDHVASCLASTGGTAAGASMIVTIWPSQLAASAATSLDPGHSGANSPRIP